MADSVSWEPLRAAMRTSLSKTSFPTTSDSSHGVSKLDGGKGPDFNEDSPHFRRLVQAIQFSKRFILSYNLVLVGIILAFGVVCWGKKILRWRRQTRNASTQVSRSHDKLSDSTDDRGQRETADEESPLLQGDVTGTLPRKGKVLATIRSWLVYQPRPIPLVNKILPPNGTSLAVLLLLGLNVFFLFYNVPLEVSMLFVFADRAALVFVANLPILYLFAAKNQPVKFFTGYSYETLNIFHRRLGEMMCLLAVLHSASMVGVWYTVLRPTGYTLAKFLLSKIILLGLGALVTYELIYFTSLGSFRQRWYEMFLGLHIVLQAVALILVWFHHSGSRPYVGTALGIFLFDRLVFRYALKSTKVEAKLEVMEDGETVKLSAIVPFDRDFRSLRPGIRSGWKVTDHVFVSVPDLSWRHNFQAHPFTISSRAPSPFAREAELRLIIRAQDGFSKELLDHAANREQVQTRFDGPYGSHAARDMLHDSDIAVLVAGGSGVAVTWPLAWSLAQAGRPREDVETVRQSSTGNRRVLFVWIVHQTSHLSWIGDQELADMCAAGVDVSLPGPTSKLGRPDLDTIITEWIERVEPIDRFVKARRSRLRLLCSGPDAMNRTVRNLCSSYVRQGRDAEVEVEKYGW